MTEERTKQLLSYPDHIGENKKHLPDTHTKDSFNPYDVKMCAQAGLPIEKYFEAYGELEKKKMRAAFLKSKVWPSNTTIKIAFLSQPSSRVRRTKLYMLRKEVDANGVSLPLDPLQETIDELPIIDAVIKVVQERIQPIVNLKLKFYDDNNNLINPNVADIRIDFDSTNGAWSLLGTECLQERDKSKATMNLGWFDVPTTIHEMLHALGMVHEHQNPKGNKINWNVKRVHEWAEKTQGWDKETTNLNIIERYKIDEINGSTFDPLSIMLYFFPGSVVDDENGQCCGEGTSQNLMFSPYDVLYLNYTYPLSKTKLTPVQFTVKFFNDIFNKQVDADDLQRQLDNKGSVPVVIDDKKMASNSMKANEVEKKEEPKEDSGKNLGQNMMMKQFLDFTQDKINKINFKDPVIIGIIVVLLFFVINNRNSIVDILKKLGEILVYFLIVMVVYYLFSKSS
jgi:hypothetical protein